MSNFKVEIVPESMMNFVGKNLFHCKDTNMMYWCDILGGQVFKMDLNNHNKLYMFRILGEKVISFCVPIHGKKDQFIVGAGRRLLLVSWDGVHTMAQIVKVLTEIPVNGVRFNQFKVDKQGRLFFGTMLSEEHGDVFDMNKRVGCLYRYTMQDGLVMLKDKIGMGNGIVWNTSYTKMYFIDSYDLMINEFDYDLKAGTFANQKVLLDLTSYCQKAKIFPGCMTMDHEDNIFMTIFGGGKLLKINTKTHKVDQEIKLMMEQPTGLEFGGKHHDTLYVVSAAMGLTHEQTYPAGYLMKVSNLGTTGVHMHKFVM